MKLDYKTEAYKAICWSIVFTIGMVFITITGHYFPNSRTVYTADTFKEIKLVQSIDSEENEYWRYEINGVLASDFCRTQEKGRVWEGFVAIAKFSWSSYDKKTECNF